MSQANVETIRRAIEAWNRGDLDGFLEGAHPDLEWHPVLAAGVEGSGGTYRGHDGARQFWGEFRAMFDEFSLVIEDARAVGTFVLILGHIHWRAHSGVPVDTPWGAVFEMRERLCVGTREFLDHGSALKAVGLSE
jgi:ketosteroid isomerase-like protein